MAHDSEIGRCHKCGKRIKSVMEAKDHVIGDIVRSDAALWKREGQKLRIA